MYYLSSNLAPFPLPCTPRPTTVYTHNAQGITANCSCIPGWIDSTCGKLDTDQLTPAMFQCPSAGACDGRFAWPDNLTFDAVKRGGYRISKETQTAKKVNVFIPGDAARTAVAILSFLGILLSILFGWLTFAARESKVIMLSQPTFLYLILGSSFTSYLSILLNSNMIISSHQCMAVTWLGHMSFSICFGALFAKTWRLNKLFNNKKLRKMRISTNFVIHIVALISTVTALLLMLSVILGAVDSTLSLQPIGHVIERSNSYDLWVKCDTLKGEAPFYVLLGYEAILLIIAAMLSFLTRNLKVSFGESKWVALSVYNILVLGILVVSLQFALSETMSPEDHYLILTISQFVGTGVTMSMIFVPKFIILKAYVDETTHTYTPHEIARVCRV